MELLNGFAHTRGALASWIDSSERSYGQRWTTYNLLLLKLLVLGDENNKTCHSHTL